jgi:hypothetical protein
MHFSKVIFFAAFSGVSKSSLLHHAGSAQIAGPFDRAPTVREEALGGTAVVFGRPEPQNGVDIERGSILANGC